MLAVAATRYFYDGKSPDSGVLQDGWPLKNQKQWETVADDLFRAHSQKSRTTC